MTVVVDSRGRQKITPGFPIGTVTPFSGFVLPEGWALCDGTGGTVDLRDRFIIGASSAGTGTPGGTSSPASALTHTGGAASNHSNHVVTQAGAHSAHTVTQSSDHSDHVITQPNDHGTHDSQGAHTHDAHTTGLRTAAGVAVETTTPTTHASQGGHTHAAHSAHSGMAVDAHGAHSGADLDGHSAHSGADLDAHSVHSVTQADVHPVLKHYVLSYIQRTF